MRPTALLSKHYALEISWLRFRARFILMNERSRANNGKCPFQINGETLTVFVSHCLFSTCGLWGNSLMTLSNDYFLNRIFLLFGYNDMNVDKITLLNFTGSKKKTQFLSVYLPNKDSVKSTIQWQDQKNYLKKL